MDPTLPSKVLVPVRYSAWLSGRLGDELFQQMQNGLAGMPSCTVARLPRGFMVEADEAPGVLLEAVHRTVLDLEAAVQERFPVFHHEMGPLWTGTLQSVFPAAPAAAPRRTEAAAVAR